MFDLQYRERGVIDVMENGHSVAIAYNMGDQVLVKMLFDGYEYSVGDMSTALQTSKIRMERY